MIKKVAIAFVVIIVALCGVIATRPATFHLERSTNIAASPDVVFGMINDLHQWNAWSPWEKIDPAMTRKHEGAAAGVGAIYYWNGNDQVGEGRMTITDSKSPEKVSIKLEFLKPWTATNQVTFTVSGAANESKVVWAMDGNNDFMGKAMSLVMNMDNMVGPDFEKGLAQLKELAEGEAKKRATEAEAQAAAAKAAEGSAVPADAPPAP